MTYPLPTGLVGGETGHVSWTNTLHGKDNDWIDAKADFNVDPANSASVNQTNLNAAFAAGESDGVAVHLPPGDIPTDGPVHWNGGYPMVQGHGQQTELNFASNADDGLVLGDGGATSGDQGMAGFVRDLRVRGPGGETAPSPNFKAGIVIDGIHVTDMANLYVRNFDIGYDLRGNSFGTTLTRCWARYRHNNVGFLMQEGPVGGNDFTLIDCWFGGVIAGIVVEPSAGGLTMIGGQLACGRLDAGGSEGADDDAGALRVGRSYEATPTTGNTARLAFIGTSWEGIDYAWPIRVYANTALTLISCSHHDGGQNALGFYKQSGGTAHVRMFGFELCDHCTFVDPLVVVSGGSLQVTEDGTWGKDLEDLGGLFADEGFTSVGFYGGNRMVLGDRFLRFNGNVLEWSARPTTGWAAV